jgi:hypothetical protein
LAESGHSDWYCIPSSKVDNQIENYKYSNRHIQTFYSTRKIIKVPAEIKIFT